MNLDIWPPVGRNLMPQPQIRLLKVTTPNAGSGLLKRNNGAQRLLGLDQHWPKAGTAHEGSLKRHHGSEVAT